MLRKRCMCLLIVNDRNVNRYLLTNLLFITEIQIEEKEKSVKHPYTQVIISGTIKVVIDDGAEEEFGPRDDMNSTGI